MIAGLRNACPTLLDSFICQKGNAERSLVQLRLVFLLALDLVSRMQSEWG